MDLGVNTKTGSTTLCITVTEQGGANLNILYEADIAATLESKVILYVPLLKVHFQN